MGRKFAWIYGLFFVILIIGLMGCGGSKETVNFEPDPFPEPVRQPVQEPVDVTAEPETPVEDISKKEPLVLLTINFDFDKSSLTDAARAILAENARKLQDNPDVNIRIEGHYDERGTVEYNLALGERRALAARDYLVNFGISPSRMTIISYGKERPIDPRHIPSAWDKNRRAEFIILNR